MNEVTETLTINASTCASCGRESGFCECRVPTENLNATEIAAKAHAGFKIGGHEFRLNRGSGAWEHRVTPGQLDSSFTGLDDADTPQAGGAQDSDEDFEPDVKRQPARNAADFLPLPAAAVKCNQTEGYAVRPSRQVRNFAGFSTDALTRRPMAARRPSELFGVDAQEQYPPGQTLQEVDSENQKRLQMGDAAYPMLS